MKAPRSVFVEYDLLAEAARVGDSAAIAAFTDTYLMRTVAFNAGPSVTARLTKAEQAFRSGGHAAISDVQIVSAWNRALTGLGMPMFMRTNVAQVGLLKDIIYRRIPNLALVSCEDDAAPTSSPTQAAFIVTFLATQKLTNGSYQVDADRWVRDMQHRIRAAELLKGRFKPAEAPRRWQFPPQFSAMFAEPRSERHPMTQTVHALLDDLGISR